MNQCCDSFIEPESPYFELYALGKILMLFGMVKRKRRRILLERVKVLLAASEAL